MCGGERSAEMTSKELDGGIRRLKLQSERRLHIRDGYT